LQLAQALVHLDRLRGNLAAVRAALKPNTQVFAVVKADAYGLGLSKVGPELSHAGIDGFVVSATAEGLVLRNLGLIEEVIVLGPILEGDVSALVAAGLSATLTSVNQLQWIEAEALRQGVRARVHVRVDLGLGAQGLEPRQLLAVLTRLTTQPCLEWASIFVQQVGGYRADAALLKHEQVKFQALLQRLSDAGFDLPLVHSQSSPGISMAPRAVNDGAVRVGALLYGLRMVDLAPPGIRPVMEIRARVLDVRMLEAGTAVSYEAGLNNLTRRKVANISIGFAMAGFLAVAANASVLVRGVRLPVLGRAFMNNLLADASELPQIEVGDEVVLLGQQGASEITAEAIAYASDIRPTGVPLLSLGLPRRYLGGWADHDDHSIKSGFCSLVES
jgi:alanine racemase